jgi:hypothetical protein
VEETCSGLGVLQQLPFARASAATPGTSCLPAGVQQWREDEVVHVRYDIGKGHRVQPASRVVVVDARAAGTYVRTCTT